MPYVPPAHLYNQNSKAVTKEGNIDELEEPEDEEKKKKI